MTGGKGWRLDDLIDRLESIGVAAYDDSGSGLLWNADALHRFFRLALVRSVCVVGFERMREFARSLGPRAFAIRFTALSIAAVIGGNERIVDFLTDLLSDDWISEFFDELEKEVKEFFMLGG